MSEVKCNGPNDDGPMLWQSDVVVYCSTQKDHDDELKRLIEKFYHDKDIEVNWEWSGAGMYRLQAWFNRPEGLPLVSLKWEGA